MVSFSVAGPKRVLAAFALLALFAYVTPASPARAADQPAPAAPTAQAASPAAGAQGAGPAEPPSETPSGEVPIKATVPIVYLGKAYEEPLPLSYAEKPIFDKGIQGARLIIKEANQAGRFVGYAFELVEAIVPANADVVAKAKEILSKGNAFIIADLEAKDLVAVADLPEAQNSIIVNIRANDEALRQELCRSNVFHIIPDWAMRADALGQYLIWKKWPRWFILRGNTPADQDYLAQVKRTAARFGAKIVGEKVYDLPPGARNTDSGYQQVQSQIPMEMQAAPEHDVVWVINSDEGFGDYVAYRTYLPRPVVGTQGLQAIAWDSSYTEYGAMHFQNGLPKLAKRRPVERDYTAWLGGRALTDGIMRSGKTTPPEVKAYLLSDAFKLEGFKGQAMSFRTWDHQLRQPIILGGGTRVPVSVSPQEGFLHETNLTDTLGFDKPETKCKFPNQ
ncbi:MAG TPA: ABC transporter substrate-binding protein [Sphingomicrobium sp.]|jgi:ABC transporter substrate binding protein (PQQ-dependent alcohol dehydrogenase system)|nr:ABC transporter substrate-binding protein [Sphingomicrobium sp.]HLO21848.1 ABC transporter substrate-binding protein [Methyloceanibacter sp.]